MDKKAKFALVSALFLVAILVLSLAIAKPGGGKTKKECNDRLDNDGDGLVDLADSGCSNKRDNDESNCGDNSCEGGETCDTCSSDCGSCPIPDSCSDSDGGFFPETQGTVSGNQGGSPYGFTDNCIDAATVQENYCSGTQPSSGSYTCFGNSTSCSNGILLPSTALSFNPSNGI